MRTRTDTILEDKVNKAGRVIEEASAERSSCRIAPVPAALVALSLAFSVVRAAEPTGSDALKPEPSPRETAYYVTDGQTTVLCARFPDEHGNYRTDTITGFPADSSWGEPSIAVSGEGIVLVCWNQGGRIVCHVKTPEMNWLGALHISNPMAEPGRRPRVEFRDDRAVCTWRGPKPDKTPGGVWRNWAPGPAGPNYWRMPEYLGDSAQVELMRDR